MPLYEYLCATCRITFEALVLHSASKASADCPACGAQARRILSAPNFVTAAGEPDSRPTARAGHTDVTRLKLPLAARLCWMDDRAAARLAAYKLGRGAEYDDTVAAHKELTAQRGDENLRHQEHDHSPLADPAVFEKSRQAAQIEKIAQSVNLKKGESQA